MFDWMLLPYRRYAEFTGRSRRKEFWLFALFQLLVAVVIGAVFGTGEYQRMGWNMAYSNSLNTTGGALIGLFRLASLIPNLAVSVRRLHDQDRSGWLLLLLFIPLFGWFALLVLFCLDGTRGTNRFGTDPKNPADIDAFG